MTFNIDANVQLELTALHHAEGLYLATDANREHLSAFLPWVKHMQSVSDFKNYLVHCEHLYKQNKEVSFVIFHHGVIAGRVGLHNIDQQHKNASIGYWLTKDAEGNGIIIRSCTTLITYAFQQLGLNRIEIKAAVNNLKSKSIAEKLGFRKEGVQREAEYLNDEFADLAIYSLLRSEWNQ